MRKNEIESVIWETRSDVIMIPFILCIEWKGSAVLLAYFLISLGENSNQIPLDRDMCAKQRNSQLTMTRTWTKWNERKKSRARSVQMHTAFSFLEWHFVTMNDLRWRNVKKRKEMKGRSPFVVAEAIRFPPI